VFAGSFFIAAAGRYFPRIAALAAREGEWQTPCSMEVSLQNDSLTVSWKKDSDPIGP
jgi:hypothetical protein